jgi:hypothetical protein
MNRAMAATACAVWLGCNGHDPSTTKPPVPSGQGPVAAVSLRPYPRVRHGEPKTGPEWCWSEPTPLHQLDYNSYYVLILVERAILSVLVGDSTETSMFPSLPVDAEGQHVFVVGPAAIDQRELPRGIHMVTELYPAVAEAWDKGSDVHIVRLELKGHVQDPAGNDALRVDYTIRGIPSGELRPSRRYGLIAGLCVVPDDDNNSELTIYTKVMLES